MSTIIKNGYKNYIVDLSTKQITMLDSRFYRTPSGAMLPSVTTILDAYPKGAAYFEWLKKNGEDSDNIRDEAGKRGSIVHDLTERYDAGEEITLMDENGNIDYKLSEWHQFEKYVEFRKRFPMTIIHSEINLISELLGFAGTLDRVVEMDGRKILIDIKTSGAIYPSYWLQLAAYEKLINAELKEGVDDVAILWLNAKTKTEGKKGTIQGEGYQLVFRGEGAERDWKLFQATHALWAAENGTMKPREMSYKLSHKIQ